MKTKIIVMACVAAIGLSIGVLELQEQRGFRLPAQSSQAQASERPQLLQASTEAVTQETYARTETMDAPRQGQRPELRAQLPTEGTLLQKGMVDSTRADIALKRENFGKVVEAFERDSRTDSLAAQMTTAYRTTIDTTLTGMAGERHLEKFSCGLSLCVGSIRLTGGAILPEDWWEGMNVGDSLSVYALSQANTQLDKSNGETRFVFSTSPTSNGFYVSPSR